MLNQTWALDFVTDTLYDGRRIRALTILDEGNREGLYIAVGISLPSRRVVRVLEDLVTVHGRPVAVRVDNGPEFLAQSFIDWAAAHRVVIHYIQPGKPDQNATTLNGSRAFSEKPKCWPRSRDGECAHPDIAPTKRIVPDARIGRWRERGRPRT